MAILESTTTDGFERQFGVNHLAHFLLFQLLKPALLSSSTPVFNSRVVSVSSMGHRAGAPDLSNIQLRNGAYQPGRAYGHAKTANIWFANYIDRHYGAQGLHALSLHPGGILTGLQNHMEEQKAKWKENEEVMRYMKSTEQGAATTVWAAVAKCWEGKGGRYLEDCQVSPPVAEGYKLLDVGFEQLEEKEVREVVYAELALEAVGGGGFGDCHDAGVVDEDVEGVGGQGEEFVGEGAHGGEGVEVEMEEGEGWGEEGGEGTAAFGQVACGAVDVRAGS